VAINGVCLTVASLDPPHATFEIVPETLRRSTLGTLQSGERVNIEHSLRAGAPIDGHFVQGHVDGVGTVTAVDVAGGDYILSITPPAALMRYMVPKGSVALDGVSLTIAAVEHDHFTVALVPTTLARTTLGERGTGDTVNIETDLLVRAVARLLGTPDHLLSAPDNTGDIDLTTLRQAGFL
jgi:riboflavin synthase alpha subunit